MITYERYMNGMGEEGDSTESGSGDEEDSGGGGGGGRGGGDWCSSLFGLVTQALKVFGKKKEHVDVPYQAQVANGTATEAMLAAYLAAMNQNKQIDAYNAQREQNISAFMKATGATALNPQVTAMGLAMKEIYAEVQAETGRDLSGLSLVQVYSQYPEAVEKGYAKFQQQFPELQGVPFQSFLNTLPDELKNMSLATVMDVLTSQASKLTPGAGSAPLSATAKTMLGVGGVAVILIILLMSLGRKKHAPQNA